MPCLPCAKISIGFEDAITIARREMERRGLAQTHHLAALHSAPDAAAEGASFAASIFPRPNGPLLLCEKSRLKFLIAHDGRVVVRRWRRRSTRIADVEP